MPPPDRFGGAAASLAALVAASVAAAGPAAASPVLAAGLAPASGAAPTEAGPGPSPQLGVEVLGRRGFYAEVGLGLFGTVGGSRGVSFAQPSADLAVGRDLGQSAAIFVQLAVGSSRASCFDGPLASCPGADSFGAAFAELGFQSALAASPRVRFSAKVLGGLTVLSPSPLAGAQGGPAPASLRGPHLGLGVGFDYDTHLDHFAVGFDLLGRHTRAGRPGGGTFGLTSFAMTPRIKYVF